MNAVFTVGVEDLRILTKAACHKNPTAFTTISLSFSLHGDFLAAATSDSLHKTVDYDALCQSLWRHLESVPCASAHDIVERAQIAIRSFSSEITGGYLSLKILCHEPFIVHEGLL